MCPGLSATAATLERAPEAVVAAVAAGTEEKAGSLSGGPIHPKAMAMSSSDSLDSTREIAAIAVPLSGSTGQGSGSAHGSDCGSDLVARTGRQHQRYVDGRRLVAGCIPIRRKEGTTSNRDVEVLLISSRNNKGYVFPKGGWETDETAQEAALREAMEEAGVRGVVEMELSTLDFHSNREAAKVNSQTEGECRAYTFVLRVTEEMTHWPEMNRRERVWFPAGEAVNLCRHKWMKEALEKWLATPVEAATPVTNPCSGVGVPSTVAAGSSAASAPAPGALAGAAFV